MTKRVHCNATHFEIFTRDVVLRDERLHFVTQRIVDRALTRYRSSTGSFSTTTRFEQRTSMTRRDATQFSRALAFGERAAESALQCS